MKKPIDMMFDGVQWVECSEPEVIEDGIPYVTHSGEVTFPGLGTMRCYRVSDGRAMLDGDDMERVFGGPDCPEEVRRMLDAEKVTIRR